MAEEGKKISFGFAKSIKKPLLKNAPVQEEKKVDYIECLDEKAIKVIGKVEEEEKPLVIPLIGSRTWHDRIINKIDVDIFEPKIIENGNNDSKKVSVKKEHDDTVSNGNTISNNKDLLLMSIKTEPLEDTELPPTDLEQQAAKEILQDLKTQQNETQEIKEFTLPIAKDDPLRGKEESTLKDYEEIPVDAFGLAMLRGMGWQPGRGIGKNEKIISAVIPELRPKGMGLGADKVTLQKKSTDVKEKQEEELKIEKGCFVKIIAGKHNNSYGQIEGLDDDAGRLIVKMAIGGNTISLNEFMVQPVTKAEYTKNAKVLMDQLRGDFPQPRDRASTSIANYDEIRLNGKLHVILTGTKKDCKVCSCRNKPGGRHETTYYCDTCPDKPRMHLDATKYEKYKNKDARVNKSSASDSPESADNSSEDDRDRSRNKKNKNENKKNRKSSSQHEVRDQKKYSSESDGDRERRRKRASSSSDEAPISKISKSSKKHKDKDYSSKHSSKKSKKDHKERTHKSDKKYKSSRSSDKRKHKKHKRSKSRSPKER